MADVVTLRQMVEVALQREIARIRDLGAAPKTVAAFLAAAEVHFGLGKDANNFEQPVNAAKPCLACKELLREPVALAPPALLYKRHFSAVGDGSVEYYQCTTCGAKLSRDQKQRDGRMRWRLI